MNSLTKKQNHCGECQVLLPTRSQLEEKCLCLFFVCVCGLIFKSEDRTATETKFTFLVKFPKLSNLLY